VKVEFLKVDSEGLVDLSDLEEKLQQGAALLSIIWANNETGVLQPMKEIGRLLDRYPTPFHSDAIAAWGKIPLTDLESSRVTYLPLSAHKIGGLSGCGYLWAQEGQKLEPIFPGNQQSSLRGGTEGVLSIAAMGFAAEIVSKDQFREAHRLGKLRDRLQTKIESWGKTQSLHPVRINSSNSPRTPDILNFCFPRGLRNFPLIPSLDLEGVSVSAGSACSSGVPTPSSVLLALGLPHEAALAAVRVSLPKGTTEQDMDRFFEAFVRVASRFPKDL
jgi:cysteine desulfurase